MRLVLVIGWSAICWSSTVTAVAGREEFEGASDVPEGSEIARLLDVPAYVISGKEVRWHHTKEVLASLHLMAERVHPSKASYKQAQEVYAVHDYDKAANLSDVVTQRELSLVATWDRLLRRFASDPNLADDDFACIFEDDIALHDDVSHTVARRAILHGMDLARKDGLLYLGSCGPLCRDDAYDWLENVEYKRCSNLCSHAVCVTRSKAGTLMSEMKSAWEADFKKYNYTSTDKKGHCIDQMLRKYAEHNTNIWTVGSNLWSMQWVWYGDQLMGLFYQDRWHTKTTIGLRRA